jgi:hypothetical protein
LALTRHFAKLSISPESSDGFASVGTILPKEEVALLPGDLFVFLEGGFAKNLGVVRSLSRQSFYETNPGHSYELSLAMRGSAMRTPDILDNSMKHLSHPLAHDLIGVCFETIADS